MFYYDYYIEMKIETKNKEIFLISEKSGELFYKIKPFVIGEQKVTTD